MAGTSQKTTTVGVRVPNETLGEWQGDAQQLGMPISGYVLARAQSGAVEVSGSVVGPVVYFIQAGEGGPVKIGWSQKLSSRIATLQTGSPVKLSLLRTVVSEPWAENWYHQEFDEQRLIGEWFTFDDRMLSLDAPAEKPTLPGRRRSILKPRSIKISDTVWEGWQAMASTAGVTALIVRSVAQYPIVLDRLRQAEDERFDQAKRRDAELAEAAARLIEAQNQIADLERQLGMWQARAERAEQAAKAPKLVVERGVTVLPATLASSDGFAARPVGSLLKSAGKPKGKGR